MNPFCSLEIMLGRMATSTSLRILEKILNLNFPNSYRSILSEKLSNIINDILSRYILKSLEEVSTKST